MAALFVLVSALPAADQGGSPHARIHRPCLPRRNRARESRTRQSRSGARGASAHAAGGKIPRRFEMLAAAARPNRRRGAPAVARAHAGGERRHAPGLRELRLEGRRAQRTPVGGLIEGGDMRRLHAFNFQNWINENQHLLKPPVGNKKVFEDGNFYDVPIRAVEVFLLPAHVRHSPQRPQEGSVGLVVEAARADPLDAFEWYCFECRALVHRIEVKVEHLVKDLPPLYEAFYADEKARKCKNCGAIHPGKRPPPGWVKI